MTLADLVAGDENLAAFADAVEMAGLTRTVLSAGGPYTVFAPSDAAFEALDNETYAVLVNDTELLDTLLLHHVVRGNYTVEDLIVEVNATENETVLETLAGDILNVSAADGNLTIENATLVTSDLIAENGVVHIIDLIIIPLDLLPPENATVVENVTIEIPAEEQRIIP